MIPLPFKVYSFPLMMKTVPLNCSMVACATGCDSFGVVGPVTSTTSSPPVNDDNGVVSMPADATVGTGDVPPPVALLSVLFISLAATMALLGARCLLQVLFWQ